MSSATTLAIRHETSGSGGDFYQGTVSKNKFEEPKSPKLLVMSLWLFSSIFSAARPDFSSNVSGMESVSLMFNIQDVILILFASWMLHRGLSTRNIALIFPWVIVTVYGLYYNHSKSIFKMMVILRQIRHATALPWIALFVTVIGLALRVALTVRTLQLAANLWYRKKLEKELYETMN